MDARTMENFFRPRSVAIVGASPQAGSSRNSIVKVLQKHRFAGVIYPVTPSHEVIEGLKAYRSVTDLPETPELALVITPAQTVPGIVAECGIKGIKNVIVYSAGFEEVESGKPLAQQLATAAKEHGVSVLGPNGQGIWSVKAHCMFTFSSAVLKLDRVEHAPIAIISQSGALAGSMATSLQSNGIGCSYIVSVGNETCLDSLDFLDWVIDQDDVRIVILYIEALHDGSRILQIASRARARGVQIVALKTGRSAVGQQATASHTGKIASSHAVYADVFEQAGVIAVNSLAEALSSIEVLAYSRDPRASADDRSGVSVVSSSGGAGALLADHSSELDIPLSEFSPGTVDRLERILPEFARKANPVDLTGQIYTNLNLFKDTCMALAEDPRTEAMVVQFASSGPKNLDDNADVFKSVAQDIPLIASFVGQSIQGKTRQALREAGVLVCGDPAATMYAMSLLYQRRRMSALPPARPRVSIAHRAAPKSWPELMTFCEESGITPAKWVVLRPDERAAHACAAMTYPLVVKVLPADAEHKTELGLVKLRVRSEEEVDAHAAEFRQRLGKPHMSVLVQEMVDEGIEVVLGCLRKTDFGPVISIGSGGVAIELYRDVVHLALPVSEQEVISAMRRLKLWTLLQGYRGKPPADIEALARAAVKLGDRFLASPDVSEFEINPVIAKRKGQGLVAVDALATLTTD